MGNLSSKNLRDNIVFNNIFKVFLFDILSRWYFLLNRYMSFFVYMLKSISKKSVTYVGYTNNLQKRIALHNSGKGAKFTKGRKWVLIYKEKFNSKSEAISREYYIKNNRSFRNKLKYENFYSITL